MLWWSWNVTPVPCANEQITQGRTGRRNPALSPLFTAKEVRLRVTGRVTGFCNYLESNRYFGGGAGNRNWTWLREKPMRVATF
jgi:hypothetical protein